jgi:hypothetical protein
VTQTFATTADVLASEFEDLARSQEIEQSVHGGSSLRQLPEAERAEGRERLWQDVTARYPELVRPDAPPPAPAPRALPNRFDADTGPIVFGGGVPVGGNGHLSLFSDGTYSFTGHFHVSGAPSYNVVLVFVVADSLGRPISFAHSGRVHGTFESGSRDDNWAGTANNAMISQLWGAHLGASWRWEAHVNVDVQAAINSAVQAVTTAATVAAIFA